MYINFNLMLKKGITHGHLLILQLSKQMKLEDVSESLIQLCGKKGEVPVQALIDSGYLELIKGKTSDSFFRKVRLTKKGAEVLDALETPLVNEDDLQLFDWLSKIYLKREKSIGNAKKTKIYLASFRVHSGIEKNALAFLLKTFIGDEKEQEYSHILQNVFFKGDTVFSTKFDIEQSRLYQYYLKNKSTFDEKFKNL
jgi:hypothetical protein